MSKGHDSGDKSDKSKEIKADAGTKKAEGGDAKHADHKPHHDGASATKGKRQEALPGHCSAWHCKAKSTQFNFCNEHFDHFKFGLIKKTGEPVPDYEKKFEHFTAHKAKRNASKVA